MVDTPSPLYVLLTSPLGWVGHQPSVVLDALQRGAWAFDPNETPDGAAALPEAIVTAFNRAGQARSTLGHAHAEILEAFQITLREVMAAGGRLPALRPRVTFSSEADRWLEAVARGTPAQARDLALAEEALAHLNDTRPKLQALREWCADRHMNWRTPLAGAPLLAHLAVGACQPALGWATNNMGWNASPGWLVRARGADRATASVSNNQGAAHQRISDALALGDWVGVDRGASPLEQALWWTLTTPLVTFGRVNAKADKLAPLLALHRRVGQSESLSEGLAQAIGLARSTPLGTPLAATVLAALPHLPHPLPKASAFDRWALAVDAAELVLGDAGITALLSGEPRPEAPHQNALKAVAAAFTQIGWPSWEWAAERDPAVSPRTLVALWWAAWEGGAALPDPALGARWRQAALADSTLLWPDETQWNRSILGRNGPERTAATAWYRQVRLDGALSEPSRSFSKVRM